MVSESRWKTLGISGCLILVGCILRVILLPTSSLWLDEVYSIQMAEKPLVEIVAVLCRDNGSPLFYFLLHGWIALFGRGEIVCTVLTVLISFASLAATACLLHELFKNQWARWVGLALMALCPMSIHHATHVRFYSMMVLLSALSYLFFFRALRRSRFTDWGLFIFFTLAGLYEHTLFLFVPFAQFLVLCLFHRDRFRAGFSSFVVIGLGFLPWVPVLFMQTFCQYDGTTADVIPSLSHYGGPLAAYLHTLAERIWTFSAVTPLRLLSAALMIAWIVFLLLKVRHKSREDYAVRDLLAAHLFSVGITVVLSLFRSVFWLDKFDLIGLPLVFGIAGYAVSRLPFTRLAVLMILAVNVAGTASWLHWRLTDPLDVQRETIERLAPDLTENDCLIQTGLTHFSVDYYLNALNACTGLRYVFPAKQKNAPAIIDKEGLSADRQAVETEAAELIKTLQHSNCERIIVFRSPYDGLQPLYDALTDAFEIEKRIPVRRHVWGAMYTSVEIYRCD